MRPHEHGVGDLSLAQDGREWLLELRIPLADLHGSESLPQEPAAQSALLDLLAQLAGPALRLDADCSTRSTELLLDPGGPVDLAARRLPAATAAAHVDLILTRIEDCALPGPARLLLDWPAAAASQPRLRAQWLLQDGQGADDLPATATELNWRR